MKQAFRAKLRSNETRNPIRLSYKWDSRFRGNASVVSFRLSLNFLHAQPFRKTHSPLFTATDVRAGGGCGALSGIPALVRGFAQQLAWQRRLQCRCADRL